jgi:Cft2 family RNA processing exonuclease
MGALRFTNLTGAVEIGANCYLLEIGGKCVLLDAGYHPKKEGNDGLPRIETIPDESVDAIILSHAHQDHIGSLPVVMRHHARAPVLMTEPTRRLGEIMLHNSINVMLAEKAAGGPPEYPLFTHREVDGLIRHWLGRPLRQRFDLAGERAGTEATDVTVEFFDAGHILGSAGTVIRGGGRTVFYAGDVQFDDQTISRGADFPDFGDEDPCDVMIMESTRGDRPTPAGFTRRAEEDRLARAINDTFNHGGCVLIPLFALGKTQELLGMFHDFRRRGLLRRDRPIYISGLGAKLTEVYDKLADRAPRQRGGLELLEAVDPYVIGGHNAADLRVKPGRILALSSGMMSEKTLSNMVARQFLSKPEHSVLFVGYADPDSPGGRLRAAKPGDVISLGAEHEPEPVRCPVQAFNFSAHASRESIRAYVQRAKPRKLILVHGDPNAVGWLAETLRADLPKTEVIVPTPGVALEL